MSITIVEPHGDDALISCYPILIGEEPIKIITLGHSRSSEKLAKHFPSIKDVIYADLYEVSIHIARAAYRESLDRHDTLYKTPWDWQLKETEKTGGNLWDEARAILKDYLWPKLKSIEEDGPETLVLAPVGLVHPYHIMVAEAFVRYWWDEAFTLKIGLYSEAPYNEEWTKPIEDSNPFVLRRRLEEVSLSPIKVDMRHKQEVLADVYPDVKLQGVIDNPYRFYLPKIERIV